MTKKWTNKVSQPQRREKARFSGWIDKDTLKWFKKKRGYTTLINNVLRAYMESNKSA